MHRLMLDKDEGKLFQDLGDVNVTLRGIYSYKYQTMKTLVLALTGFILS